jgi:hypothetical protein
MKLRHFACVGVSSALVAGVLAAVVPVAAATATVARPGSRASAPAGYVVVHTDGSNGAPFGLQTHASVMCPAGTRPLSGGVDTPSSDLAVNMNSSYPTGRRSWTVKFNNGSPDFVTFRVFAVCVKRSDALFTVNEATFAAPPHVQTPGGLDCPSGVVVGGGVHSSSKSTLVNIASIAPASTTRWDVWINNASNQRSTFTTYTICRKKAPPGYAFHTGTTADNPGGSETYTDVACDGASVPLSGGAYSFGGGLGQNVNCTAPAQGGWFSYFNNANADDNSVRTLVVCAGT